MGCKSFPNENTFRPSYLRMQINVKWKEAGAGFYLTRNDLCCWGETRVEAVWLMTLGGRTKYGLVLSRSRELCELCSARRGRGGGGATSEAIIWGWDHCLAPSLHAYGPQRLSQAAQRAALSHLCVRKDIFSEFGWRTLCPADGFVISPFVEQPSVRRIHVRRVSRCGRRCQKRVRAMSLTLTHLAAHWLLSGPCEYFAFGRTRILYFYLSFNVL